MTQPNTLYFGDNLNILRDHIDDASVDLIYLDPPFNSKRDYNLLFKTPKGHQSDAQITAFEDTWHWASPNNQAEREYDELLHQPNTDVAALIRALYDFLKPSDMLAYLVMMANRLLELHRVLKPTGSLYLHCDPTASHYLKILLDAIFGAENFRSEVDWKRTSSHNSAKRWSPVHDVILFYSKTEEYVWNKIFEAYDETYLENFYKFSDDKGRFRLSDLTGSGTRTGDSGKAWRDVNPTNAGRHWAVPNAILQTAVGNAIDIDKLNTQEKLDLLDKHGLIYFPPKGKVPQLKRYFDPNKGNPIQDVIIDIPPIGAQADERLGYPTQKPLALLERIISASSNPGDLVLDPFCGCGTAIHAAQNLGRSWVGIDITSLAINEIEKRMAKAFPGLAFKTEGTPQDLDGARELAEHDKYQFQFWACALVNAQPYRGGKKGADTGIDGIIYFQDDKPSVPAGKIIVSVKGGDTVNVSMVRDLAHVVERENAVMGFFVTLAAPTKPMLTEAASAGLYQSPSHGAFPKIQILTIQDLLNGKKPEYVDLSHGAASSKQAKIEQSKSKQGQLL